MKLLPSRCILCTQYSHVPCHFMQSHIRKVHANLAVTCHLHFWQNDRFFLTIIGGSCHKYHFCREKHVSVATKHLFCRDKSMLVATNLLSRQKYFCLDKYLSQQTQFCPATNDLPPQAYFSVYHLSRQKLYLCHLPPMILYVLLR